jgi:hypothetical protein
MTNTLEDFAKSVDPRTSLFDVKIDSETNGIVTLSGRVLDATQLDELPRLLPNRKLDTSAIRVLNAETHEPVHVATNLTGLYEKPTFGMPLSSELTYGTELEVLDPSGQGNWVFTRQRDGYLGWAYRPYLGEGLAPVPTHLVLAPAIELRAEPSADSDIVTRLVSGTGVVLGETNDGWVQVQANRAGWVQSVHLRAVSELPKTPYDRYSLFMGWNKRQRHRLFRLCAFTASLGRCGHPPRRRYAARRSGTCGAALRNRRPVLLRRKRQQPQNLARGRLARRLEDDSLLTHQQRRVRGRSATTQVADGYFRQCREIFEIEQNKL